MPAKREAHSGPLLRQCDLDLISRAEEIEREDAKEAGAIGFMARAIIQATMPHSDPGTGEFRRKNGNYTLVMLAPSDIGLPYGSIPRLVLSWISTEAVCTKEPQNDERKSWQSWKNSSWMTRRNQSKDLVSTGQAEVAQEVA